MALIYRMQLLYAYIFEASTHFFGRKEPTIGKKEYSPGAGLQPYLLPCATRNRVDRIGLCVQFARDIL